METKKDEIQKPAAKVTATKDVDFPSLDWAIKAGEVRELPADGEAQAAILSNHFISEVTK